MYEFPDRIVITGADGQLGWEFVRQLGNQAIPLSRRGLDLADAGSTRTVLEPLRPYAVINCAAYTLVDRAESEPEVARQVNADAVRELAEVCRRLACRLVQISTDYVFDGSSSAGLRAFREEDPVDPQGVYARTKYAGEQYAAQAPNHLIVRTCGLYGHAPGRGNFVGTMSRLARTQPNLRVVNDQRCSPTYVPHLARAILFLLQSSASGLYHVVNDGDCSWFDFARAIVKRVNPDVDVVPISTEEFGAKAPRPRHSVLDTSKYRALGGPPLPDWQDALAEYFERDEGVDATV